MLMLHMAFKRELKKGQLDSIATGHTTKEFWQVTKGSSGGSTMRPKRQGNPNRKERRQ